MIASDTLTFPVLFELVLAVSGALLTCLLALAYLRRVRLERPAIGTFNGRDVATVFVFIVGLPLLYVVLPLTPLLVVLGFTFTSALSIGLRPLLPPAAAWLVIGVLIGLNVWMARTLLGTVLGWQLFWLENSVIVMAAAIIVANLYVQGGMRLKHVTYFGLALAVYDVLFTFVWPITNELLQRFLGWPFDPAIGFRLGIYNASLGLGDLLVYSLFTIAAYKAYGRRALRPALVLVVVFGAAIPALSPLIVHDVIDARTDLVVPAQTSFGPAAYLCRLWFVRRFGRERTMAEFLASGDLAQPAAGAAGQPSGPVEVVDLTRPGRPVAPAGPTPAAPTPTGGANPTDPVGALP